MAFSDAVARDVAHIHARTGGEFVVDVLFWVASDDPDTDPATTTTKGTRFVQAMERTEAEDGEHEMTRVTVTVTRAEVASIDEEGYMSVDGVLYQIEYVHGADPATWTVRGSRDTVYSHGNSSRLFGD